MNNHKVYRCICADPPWSFGDKLKSMKDGVKRSADSQYDVMPDSDIKAMRVQELADPTGCILALWVPSTMLQAGIDTMSSWGFTLKQTFIWVKTKKDALQKETDMNKMTRVGMGRLFRQSHEIALIGTSGKSVYKFLDNKGQRSVAFDLNEGHSIKPPTLQERLELMFPDSNRLELFARRLRPGWDCLGNEIDGKDINDAIQDIIDVVETES